MFWKLGFVFFCGVYVVCCVYCTISQSDKSIVNKEDFDIKSGLSYLKKKCKLIIQYIYEKHYLKV